MGHETEHASTHEDGGADALDMSNIPPVMATGQDDTRIYTTGGWTLAKRFTKALQEGKYLVIMSASCESNGCVQTCRVDITDHPQVVRWWEGQGYFENKTAIFILDASTKSYNFDFYYRRHSGLGTAYISDIRLAVIKLKEAS